MQLVRVMLQSALRILIFLIFAQTAHGQQSRWTVEEKRGSIDVYAEFDPGMQDLWNNVNDVTRELEELLGVEPSGESIQIILFRDQASYLRYLASSIPQSRQRKAIFYQNGDVCQVYAFRSRTLITDLRHEMTHAILHQHLQFLPLWVDEGLAEYLEEPESSRAGSSRTRTARWQARFGWSPSIKSLEAIATAESMNSDEYRDSWAMICLLLNESDASRKALREYLAVIHKGEAPGPFSEFQKTVESGVFSRANSYLRKMSIRLSSESGR
ncbi:MAG TPA: hypothetical protein PLY87_05245 [Planctomycetaceae bacterium]|nr:hypothetical protein [Planctomycetaceae bacterium]HRA86986.1 hypothetical protein [Planctomycetaceae bacterium]